MIKLIKPKFWDSKTINFFSILLSPLTLITMILIFFKKKISKEKAFEIPIICVGNIYIGGTSKTPTSILLSKELSILGFKPVIIRKFYANHEDEYKQIRNNFNNLIVGTDGINIIKLNKEIMLLFLMMVFRIIKLKVNIICFNQNQLVGNDLL